MSVVTKVCRWASRLLARYPVDAKVTAIRQALQPAQHRSSVSPSSVLAVQCLEDRFYFAMFGTICRQRYESEGSQGELVVVRSISGSVGVSWRQQVARSMLLGRLRVSQWVRAFGAVAPRVAYRSLSLTHPVSDVLDWFRSKGMWNALRAGASPDALEVLGVPAGDLIVDSYLRFRPSPCFDPQDPFVRQLIWQAHRDVRRARAYFRSRKPSAYLTSYSTYIEHGIPVRVALQEGVRVRSFGSFAEFSKELSLADWFHTPDTSGYRSTFDSLPGQGERLAEAEAQLRRRLSGGIDTATSYMRVSAYAESSAEVPDVTGAVVLFLHDFYDSPHVYEGFIFADFWQWTCFTIDALRKAGRRFFVKAHPNQISLSREVLDQLQAKYPDLPLLPPGITNVQLASGGIACGLTVYGTVAHELAYLGVPTIACAKHPHHSFGFCRTARSIEEYARFLQTADEMPLSGEEMRRQSLAFYYMHNLHGDAASLWLREQFVRLWKACHDDSVSSEGVAQCLRELRESPAFVSCLQRMLAMPDRRDFTVTADRPI